MSDVEQAKINNITYDIKDPTKVSKSGDTMTGVLRIKDVNINDSTPPSGTIYGRGFAILDANEYEVARFRSVQYSNKLLTDIFCKRSIGGTDVYNNLSLAVKNDGTPEVIVDSPSAWRNALGLGDSGWQSLTDNTKFTGTILYRKIGKLVEIVTSDGITLKTALTSANIILTTLPSGYKPHAPVQSYAGNILNHACARIEMNGDLYFHKPNDLASWATTSSIRFNFTYFVD